MWESWWATGDLLCVKSFLIWCAGDRGRCQSRRSCLEPQDYRPVRVFKCVSRCQSNHTDCHTNVVECWSAQTAAFIKKRTITANKSTIVSCGPVCIVAPIKLTLRLRNVMTKMYRQKLVYNFSYNEKVRKQNRFSPKHLRIRSLL